MAVVAVILCVVAALTASAENHYSEWIGAVAVLLTFAHVQVADRLAETESTREMLRRDALCKSQLYEHAHEKLRPPLHVVKAADERYWLHVDCHHWARRYLVSKEICWLIYFVMLGAWSALVGVGVFLLYPVWRHYYRKRYPLEGLK